MSIQLSNGVSMPLIGFGTFRIKGKETIFGCIEAALKFNYKSFDTAVIYKNEEDIGSALEELLPKFSVQREELFITSKLSPKNQGYESCIASVQNSLQLLKTSYLNLYLIHWPGVSGKKVDDPINSKLRQESWKALEHCYQLGLIKAIGVSNYCINHLEEMKQYATVFPHVLQVEHHPHFVQKELLKYCTENKIHYQAYSSLGTTVTGKPNPLLEDQMVNKISEYYQKSTAQILLRWSTQQGIGVLPKSLNPVHIQENIELDFLLSEEEINTLNQLERNSKYAWDPSVVV